MEYSKDSEKKIISESKEINIISEKNTEKVFQEYVLEDNVKLKINMLVFEGNHEFKFILKGINSGIEFNCIYLMNNQKYDLLMHAVHENENCYSRLESNGVLKNSESNIRGIIQIEENSNNSDGYEKSNAIIIENSRSISIPDLIIKNNNVKCSHGSSVTRLDKDKIFYLMSRGLSKEDASKIIIKGFYDKQILKIEDQEFRKKIEEELIEKINNTL